MSFFVVYLQGNNILILSLDLNKRVILCFIWMKFKKGLKIDSKGLFSGICCMMMFQKLVQLVFVILQGKFEV